jgi:hypothetical protein
LTYNNAVDQATKYHAITFEATAANHALVAQNVQMSWDNIARRSRVLCDKIEVAVRELEQSLLV